MSGIKQICSKELARVLKDRKMVVSVFIVPVAIMIVVMSLVSNLTSSMMEDVEEHAPIIYLQDAPESFTEYLKAYDPDCEILQADNLKKVKSDLRSGEADLWIEFPADFEEQITSYQQGHEIPQVKVYYNPSEDYSSAAYSAVTGNVLETYRQTLLSRRVADMDGLTVFTVNSDNPGMEIQDEKKAGGKALGMMLPYFVTVLLFAGAMGIGTDMVAGEKERGTMASMLVAPIKRSSIVLGKVFALMIISGISSVIYVAAMVAFMPQMMGLSGDGADSLNLSLNAEQIVMLALLLIAIAFLYSGIIVLLSVFAKGVKEASSLITPVYMLILVLGILTMFTTDKQKDVYFVIPIYNTSIALQGILSGEITMLQYGMALGSTLILGAVLIVIIARAFESEKVMNA